MATTRPFAYNTGSTIDGTIQMGNIAIGVSDQDYSQNPGGVKWWMGPDEELGYIIAHEVPTGDQSTPVDEDASLAFWRSTELTDQSFLDLLNVVSITDGLPPFTTISDAQAWLDDNGHFTSYGNCAPSFSLNLGTIASHLRNFMSDFRNPDFYNYDLDGNGFYIDDGDSDMYDEGNATTPWLISNVTYTGDTDYTLEDYPYAIDYQTTGTTGTMDTTFSYISLGYENPDFLPLTVIGTRTNVGDPVGFQCGGNIGADGNGTFVEGNIYTGDTVSGFTVHSYYRQTYNANDPSVCDVFILLGHSCWNSVFGDVFYGGDSSNEGCGSYLFTSGSSVNNILSIKTLLSNSNENEVTFSEVKTVVDNFISRISESQINPITPTPTPTPGPTDTPTPTPTIDPSTPTPTPTPGPTDTPTPTPSPTPTIAPLSQKILFLGDGQVTTNATDLNNTLQTLGYSATIDTQELGTTYDGNNIASGNYGLIIMQTNGNQNGAAQLSDNLKTFMDNGGHFIGQTFLWSIAPSGFDYTYTPFISGGYQGYNGGNLTLVNSHPVLGGLTYSSIPSSLVNNISTSLQSNSTLIYKFADNMPLLAVQEVGSSRRVGLNYWDTLTSNKFSGKVMATSILWCLGIYDVTPTPTPAPTETPTPTPTPINHPYQIEIIGTTDVTGPFFNDLNTACSALDCLTVSSCSTQNTITGYVDDENLDNIYVSSNSNETVSLLFDGYYIINVPGGLYLLTEFTNSQFVRLVDCVAPTPTPTPSSTPGPTGTPTPTPEMATLTIIVPPGTPSIIFDGDTYTSNVTAGVVKNQQYSINSSDGTSNFWYWSGTGINLPAANSQNTIVFVTGNTATLEVNYLNQPTATPTPTPTDTPIPATSTPTPAPTDTPTPEPTATETPTPTPNGCTYVSTYYTVDISQNDIDDATGSGVNNSRVRVSYKDCNGTTIMKYYTVAGLYTNDICVQEGEVPTVIYYKSNIPRSGISSATNTLVDCGISPTPTPTPTGLPATETPTPEPTVAPTDTPTPELTATDTPTPLPATSTPTPEPTATSVPATETPTPTPIAPTSTSTPSPTETPTPTPLESTATPTPTVDATSTPTPTPTSGGSGVGSWYFYSDEGNLNAFAPVSSGNTIFTINTGTTIETFNPNKIDGVSYLYFNTKDSSGADYTSQFGGYTGGTGTITISQNGDTATYTSTTSGSFTIENIGGGTFFKIDTNLCTQTKTSNAPYVYADPISLAFNSLSSTPTPTPDGPTATPTPTSTGGGDNSWYFYTPFGNQLTIPPLSNGQTVFYSQAGGPPVAGGSPNNSSGQVYLMFYKIDSTGTSYETQFGNLSATGGTINVTQNGQTATYTSSQPNAFFVDNSGFLIFNASLQTATVANPFTYTDPISITFGNGGAGATSTPTPIASTSTPTPVPTDTPTPLPTDTPTETSTPTPTLSGNLLLFEDGNIITDENNNSIEYQY
jgi:cell division septation protein DedD